MWATVTPESSHGERRPSLHSLADELRLPLVPRGPVNGTFLPTRSQDCGDRVRWTPVPIGMLMAPSHTPSDELASVPTNRGGANGGWPLWGWRLAPRPSGRPSRRRDAEATSRYRPHKVWPSLPWHGSTPRNRGRPAHVWCCNAHQIWPTLGQRTRQVGAPAMFMLSPR